MSRTGKTVLKYSGLVLVLMPCIYVTPLLADALGVKEGTLPRATFHVLLVLSVAAIYFGLLRLAGRMASRGRRTGGDRVDPRGPGAGRP